MNLNLSNASKEVVLNALCVARDRYRLDASKLRAMDGDYGQDRLIEQFEKQARECEELIPLFEE